MGTRPPTDLGDQGRSQGAIKFNVQTVPFRSTPEQAWLEISYELPQEQLQFISADSAFSASFNVSAMVFDERRRQVAGDGWERSLRVKDYTKLGRNYEISADTLGLPLAPGRYRVKVICRDNNSERSGTAESIVLVPDFFAQPLSLAGVRFERTADGGFSPWPRKLYGEIYGPVVAFLRLYSPGLDTALLSMSLSATDQGMVQWARLETLAVSADQPVRRAIPVDSLRTGVYALDISATDLSGRSFGSIRELIDVRNAGRQTTKEFSAMMDQLAYIVPGRELQQMKNAPPGIRDSLVEAFWRSKDPTPNSEQNEYRDEFSQRVEYVNRHYSLGPRPGWRTDQGRIYIKYGPPDDIERHTFDPEYPAYEVWSYYNQSVQFLFMDVHGYGEFQLMNPKAEKR